MPNILNLKKRPPAPESNTPPVVNAPVPSKPAVEIKTATPISQTTKQTANVISWAAHLQRTAYGKKIIWVLGLLILSSVLLLEFDGSLLLLVLMVLASVMILFARTQPARDSKIEIGNAGISIDGHTRYWRELHSFWIEYNPGSLQELSLQMRKPYLPRLTIPLAGQDPMKIRRALMPFIPEEEHELSVIDAILKRK